MKTTAYILSIVLLISFSSCCDDENIASTVEECHSIKDSTILPEEEKQSTCIYNEVYRYNSEIITLCVCCVCDKEALLYDCDGNLLCDFGEGCFENFSKNAQYLFSVK